MTKKANKFMIVGLVVIFGAVVGFVCFKTRGSGFGMWWDMMLGVSGCIIANFAMSAAYILNGFGRADIIGLNWYSMVVGGVGALLMVYGSLLYNRADPISKIGFKVIEIK